jgi:sugar lactone lactonase YvrE
MVLHADRWQGKDKKAIGKGNRGFFCTQGCTTLAAVSESVRSLSGAMGSSAGAVWVVHSAEQSPFELERRDAVTGSVTGTVKLNAPIPDDPKFVIVDHEDVWVSSEHSVVHRVHGPTLKVTAVIEVGNQLGRAAVCGGSIWVPSGHNGGAVIRIDPRTNSVIGAVQLPYPRQVVAAGEAVWISHGSRVTRMDPRTGRTLETFDLGDYVLTLCTDGQGTGAGAGVWVTTLDAQPAGAARGGRESGGLFRLAPGVSSPARLARFEGRADGLCVGAGAVWVASASLARFDLVQAEMHTVLDEVVSRPTVVGNAIWATRYDYAQDVTALITVDCTNGSLTTLDTEGNPSDLAVN